MAYSLDTGLIAIAAYGVLIIVNQLVCTFCERSFPRAGVGKSIQLRNVKIRDIIRSVAPEILPAMAINAIAFILVSCVFIIGILVSILINSEIADFAGVFKGVLSLILTIPVILPHLNFLVNANKQLTPKNAGIVQGLSGAGYFIGVYWYFTSFNPLWLILVAIATLVFLVGLPWPTGKR